MAIKLQDIVDLYKEVYETNDEASIALVAAILIGYKIKGPPVWLYLIGPSSSGKTSLIDAFMKVNGVHQISDLTPNTFLSGASSKDGKPASLLVQLGREFVIMMKDFTTILSKSAESQEAIIAQMREIYDGHLVKYTGTGSKVEWGGDPPGHGTFIMACTEAIYAVQDKFSDMGTRAINYVLMPIDRVKATKKALRSSGIERKKKDEMQDVFAAYVDEMRLNLPEKLPYIDEELEDEIIEVSDFASVCRSVVKRDYKGAKSLALSAELPMRISKQLLTLAQIFIYMNDGKLPDHLRKAIFKVGFDSIPKQRRLVLASLTEYHYVHAGAVADRINYPPERAKEWLEDLNMFGVVDRVKRGHKQLWVMRDEWRKLIAKHYDLKLGMEDLDSDDSGEQYVEAGGKYEDIDVSFESKEEMKDVQKSIDDSFDSV